MAALAIASVVYSQFNLYGSLGRDSAIYVYGGQQVTHGVPPYASIMDPKGPISDILCGFGAAVARLIGRDDVLVIRVEFAALCILSVLGIYLLVLEVWHSVVAGVVAAAVFTWFEKYAADALHGPDGHTPGIVFLVFAMWLTMRKRWYWAGFAASLAFLSWQPLFAYPVIVMLCSAAWSPGHRLRAVCRNIAGALSPLAILFVYYIAEGYPGSLFEGTFLFPLTGTYRPPVSFSERLRWIFTNIPAAYGTSSIFLWVGLLVIVGVAVWTMIAPRSGWRAAVLSPMVLLFGLTLLAQVGYLLYDYIGWTHAFPLLPYGAVGVGAAAAYLLHRLSRVPMGRRIASATLLAVVTALTVVYAVAYYEPSNDTALLGEKASACAIQRSLAPRTTLWVIDQPVPLVLLHRRNPDSYPYVGSGLANWKVEHTPGGFDAWTTQIKARASVVVMDGWREVIPVHAQMKMFLRTNGYHFGYIGPWKVWVTNAARTDDGRRSIALSHTRHEWPVTPSGRSIDRTLCR